MYYIIIYFQLELTISSLQAELQQTKNKLEVHDTSAKKAVATLQNELRLQIDKVIHVYNYNSYNGN